MSELNEQKEFQIIRERMKERPVNRKKLLRRVIITASMAVIFGVLACITIIVLEPVFSNILTPEEEPERIEIRLDEEEMLPTDMLSESTLNDAVNTVAQEGEENTAIDNYVQLYSEIHDLVSMTQRSLVTVAGVNQDIDWFDNEYENKGTTTGLIIANNNKELLILCNSGAITGMENIQVLFYNGTAVEGSVKKSDENTGLSIVAVDLDKLSETLLDPSIIANLGNSKPSRLLAAPVIAVGRPMGTVDSVAYGMITSKGYMLNLKDSNYEMFYTDIHGNDKSNGVIINMNGDILGIIDQQHNQYDRNVIASIGISDIKRTIERLSNGEDMAVLGVTGKEITAEALANGVPEGAYVTGIDMDSPAMRVGIQSGDVIVKIDGIDIARFSEFTEAMYNIRPEAEINMTIKRYDGEEYRDIDLRVNMGTTH